MLFLMLYTVWSLSYVQLFATPGTAAFQAFLYFTISWRLLKLIWWCRWCHPTISSSVICFSSCIQLFLASGYFPVSWLFSSCGQNIDISVLASASVLPMNIQDGFPLGLTVWSPCSPRDSQESSPKPQVKSISSSLLSLLYGPTLTSICDYLKNHSVDYMDLCQQHNVSAF